MPDRLLADVSGRGYFYRAKPVSERAKLLNESTAGKRYKNSGCLQTGAKTATAEWLPADRAAQVNAETADARTANKLKRG